MSTLSPEISEEYRVASAFPGRIRLQVALRGSGRLAQRERAARLQRLAACLSALDPVQSVETAPDAGSVIVRYAAKTRSLEAMLARVHQAGGQALNGEAAASMAYAVSAVSPSGISASGIAASSGMTAALQHIRKQVTRERGGPALKWAAQKIAGEHERITAYTLPPENPRGLKSLIMPTVAVALAALEALPVAAVGAALAVATMPIAQRAAKRRSKSILSVDILDTVNIALLALEGSFLPASVVAWLITLGELLRGETVLRSRRALISAVHEGARRSGAQAGKYPSPQQIGRILARLEHRTLSDTRLQDNALRSSRSLAWPATAAALFVFGLSRDPGDLIGIIKPGKDFSSATRFGLPAGLLNAITQGYSRNIEFESGRAVEALARADAFVFHPAGADADADALPILVESLLKRGALQIVLPTGAGARRAEMRAEELGQAGKVILLQYEAGAELRLLDTLRAQGRKPALVDIPIPDRTQAVGTAQVLLRSMDHLQAFEEQNPQHENGQTVGQEGQDSRAESAEQVKEAQFAEGDTEDAGELILPDTPDTVMYSGPAWSLPVAIDLACQATAVSEQNTALAGTAALFNFVTNVMRVSPAPLSTLINTITLAWTSRNALRTLRAPAAPSFPALLPPLRLGDIAGQEAKA